MKNPFTTDVTILDSSLFRLAEAEPRLVARYADPAASISQEIEKPSLFVLRAASVTRDNNGTVGLKWLQDSRLEGNDKQAIVFSFEPVSQFREKFPIVESKGVVFSRLPITRERLMELIKELDGLRLSKTELAEVCRWKSGLQKPWRDITHHIRNLLTSYPNSSNEILSVVDTWTESIKEYAPDQLENLERLQNFLSPADGNVAEKENISRALEILSVGLLKPHNAEPSSGQLSPIPPLPPKGFSTVLIADDNPQGALKVSLRAEFGYQVIEKQAMKLPEALRLLEIEKPDVVLADLYFKRSERITERPDPAVGEEFIKRALGSQSESEPGVKKPLVLVTSKAPLRTDDIPFGAINCSGERATDGKAVHAMIWTAAREMGVEETERLLDGPTTGEIELSKRLDDGLKLVTTLESQMTTFPFTLLKTLTLARLLSNETQEKERRLVDELIAALSGSERKIIFSRSDLETIFERVSRIHSRAKQDDASETNQHLRDILHGKIEQFSSMLSGVRALQRISENIAMRSSRLSIESLDEFRAELSSLVNEIDSSTDLGRLLREFSLLFRKAVEALPPVTNTKSVDKKPKTDADNVEIVMIEDDDHWAGHVQEAVSLASSRLEARYRLTTKRFTNAGDALLHVKKISRTHAIANNSQRPLRIAVADICLPENADHAAEIASAETGIGRTFKSPSNKHGVALIEQFSDYDRNIPVIVFSTIDSLADRQKVCSLGVPERCFISKSSAASEQIAQSIVRFVERANKYTIRRFTSDRNDGLVEKFRLNEFELALSPELSETFAALFSLCGLHGKNSFTIREIIEVREGHFAEEFEEVIKDHVHKLRRYVFELFRRNRAYINVREFIKTHYDEDNDQTSYQINAEIRDEEWYEDDLDTLPEKNRILLIETDSEMAANSEFALRSHGYEVVRATDRQDAITKFTEFDPHLVSIGLDADKIEPEVWRELSYASTNRDTGVIVRSGHSADVEILNAITNVGIPLSNLVISDGDWLSKYIQAIKTECRRVFLGEKPDLGESFVAPIVEILEGCDFELGRLRLRVNGSSYQCGRSQIARVLGYLINRPNETVSYEEIKSSIVGGNPVTRDDRRNWPKRIRSIIREDWLADSRGSNGDDAEMLILESSESGLKLNVNVVKNTQR